jgi:signal transduction histidine kinase/ActR/RegA family two-component response regulator
MREPLSRPTRISVVLVILLLLATPILLAWQHYGMIRTVEISARQPHGVRITDDRTELHGNSVGSMEVTKDAVIMRCAVGGAVPYPNCKLQFLLGEPGKGIDLSRFDSVTLDVRHFGRKPHQVKLHVLNFDPDYASLDEWDTQRVNEALIQLDDPIVTIPMHALRTGDWWRRAHKLPLSKSYLRLDHVTAVELTTNFAGPGQVVTVELRSIRFRGKWISQTALLTGLVSAWIACGLLGLSLGLLHYRANLSRTRSRLEQLAAIDRERKAAEAAREVALAEAVGLARQRSQFLAQMSHELRTPLNAIIGYAQLLRRDQERVSRQQLTTGLTTIHESGQHLLTLINDILDLARVEAGKMDLHPAPVHLASFLRVVADIMRVKAEEKGLAFRYELAPGLPDAVAIDETRLRQVLLNLLGNAVKFTDSGTVALRVLPVPRQGTEAGKEEGTARLRFEVADSGIGMNTQQLARLFQPFEQVADRQRREGGTGLGLAISQQLVRLMGGTIGVASEPGKGSTFSFELTVQVADGRPSERESPHAIVGYEGERRRVLIADDVAPNRAMLVDLLHGVGFIVAAASNGLECLVLLDSFKPDLVLMDVMMPVMDGNETTRRIRRMPQWSSLPVIAVTASASREDEARCREAGANAFLAKPVDHDALLCTIGSLLSLQWTLGKPVQEPAGEAGELVAPPAQEIEALWQLARLGSMREIRERANYLRGLDPVYAPFAARLDTLAQGYHSKELAAFVGRYRTADAVPPS